MKQKRMKLVTKLIIYVSVFAIGGYFFFKYMPQGFKNMVSPTQSTPDTVKTEVLKPDNETPAATSYPEAAPDTTAHETVATDTIAPASPEVSPAQ
ncbi:MAG: hypothetical protein IKQ70_00455 [Bacteroidales bacterium]|nr:hypothetical protein [Bacteroidales bacterium]